MRDPLPQARGRALLKVVGLGNPWRRDDAAGLAVARRLRGTLPEGVEVLEHAGEPTGLIDAWEGAAAVWLVDAVSSGAAPGTVHRLDASRDPLPLTLFRPTTHHFGVADAVELARCLGRLPERLVVWGIEGECFEAGEGLTEAVALAAEAVAGRVREEAERSTRDRSRGGVLPPRSPRGRAGGPR